VNSTNKIIFAPATPVGESSITVIRISGIGVFSILNKIFSKSPDSYVPIDFSQVASHTLLHGYLVDGKEIVDEVVVGIFKSPNSYTGEDVVEISSHGGRYNFKKINKLLINYGCIHSEPGEFTKRAFLNGKIDLVQAEAISDLIRAKTELASKAALHQLSGEFSRAVDKLRGDLINYCSLVELELDFSEEGLEVIAKDVLLYKLNNIIEQIKKFSESYDSGRIVKEGVNLTITGNPNVGKSTIFNYLLKENRAIVTDIPGTTRDYIEEPLIMGGLVFNLVDTAGIRETSNKIEKEGVERSFKKIVEADLVLNVIDSTNPVTSHNGFAQRSITVYNKMDIANNIPENELCVSALTGQNMEELQNRIIKEANSLIHKEDISELYVTNERHRDCLLKSCEYLVNSKKLVEEGAGNELISFEIREALHSLEEIIGKTSNVDILNNIFSKFCIGK
jgi:tRNA modification GTPase